MRAMWSACVVPESRNTVMVCSHDTRGGKSLGEPRRKVRFLLVNIIFVQLETGIDLDSAVVRIFERTTSHCALLVGVSDSSMRPQRPGAGV